MAFSRTGVHCLQGAVLDAGPSDFSYGLDFVLSANGTFVDLPGIFSTNSTQS
jgi:hypothetical protein